MDTGSSTAQIESYAGRAVALSGVSPLAFLTGVLIARDPGATVSGDQIDGSCAPGCSPVSPTSPRLVVVGLFDPAEDPTGPSLHLTNFLSFFVEDMEPGGIVHGRLLPGYGIRKPQSPIPSDDRAFLGIPNLVR